jgi:hypothetical protein
MSIPFFEFHGDSRHRGAQKDAGSRGEFTGRSDLLQHRAHWAAARAAMNKTQPQSLFQASNRARLPVMQCSRLPLTDAPHRFFLGSEARAAFMRLLEVLPER